MCLIKTRTFLGRFFSAGRLNISLPCSEKMFIFDCHCVASATAFNSLCQGNISVHASLLLDLESRRFGAEWLVLALFKHHYTIENVSGKKAC